MDEDHKQQIRLYFEHVWNRSDFGLLRDLLAEDYVDHNSPFPPGIEGVEREMRMYRAAFPDLTFVVHDLVAEGDKVVARVSASGTHRGDLPGIPATGKHATMKGILIMRFEGRKAKEAWMSYDFLGLYRQLGAISQQ